ncbi:cytochrome c oxidase assembly protein [Methylobacillus caricis]|uniref:cytochrome c oxidase assembly protein n=1 Tax=Methylobacillus caricis TaxID=1971611 RepID=UPI001D0010BE|nr:cytochrome c oxidase assembly protein [Methylobacillus caricis]MCB5187500.1 cytochrome c oxidase assembly protein [Methylobacillus caricis]
MKRLLPFLLCLYTLQSLAHPVAGNDHHTSMLQLLKDYWVAIPILLSLILYLIGIYRLTAKAGRPTYDSQLRTKAFLVAWIILVIALLSPVDTLGNAYFSVHMVQHELLMIISAPLFVLARPLPIWAWAVTHQWAGRIGRITSSKRFSSAWRFLTTPLFAWIIHASVLWGWHVPALFEAALHDTLVHDIQHLSFFFSALLFWWSLVNFRRGRNTTVSSLVSLFTTALHTALLGALLTFSNKVWYPTYAATVGGSLELALQDQQLGGLIMWIPGGLAYLAVALFICYRLLSMESRNQPAIKPANHGHPSNF